MQQLASPLYTSIKPAPTIKDSKDYLDRLINKLPIYHHPACCNACPTERVVNPQITPCGHVVCPRCIKKWLRSCGHCPCCPRPLRYEELESMRIPRPEKAEPSHPSSELIQSAVESNQPSVETMPQAECYSGQVQQANSTKSFWPWWW